MTDIAERPASRAAARRSGSFRSGGFWLLVAVTIVWLSPMAFLVVNAVKTAPDYARGALLLPESFHFFENLAAAWQRGMRSGFLNSLAYGLVGSVLAVFLATMAAYGIVRLRLPRALAWFLLLYSGTVFPFQMYLIPLFRAYTSVGLYDTRLGMFALYTAICIPFAVFVMRGFFLTVPWDIQEAARIDGAGSWTIFRRLMLPLAKAPFLMLTLVQFTWIWNDLIFGMVLGRSESMRPVQVALTGMQNLYGQADAPTIITATLLASAPTLILFLLLQKHFVRGLSVGAVGGR